MVIKVINLPELNTRVKGTNVQQRHIHEQRCYCYISFIWFVFQGGNHSYNLQRRYSDINMIHTEQKELEISSPCFIGTIT